MDIGETWGDDGQDLELDDDGNPIPAGGKKRDDDETADGAAAAGWDVDDAELDLPPELVDSSGDAKDDGAGMYVPPSSGQPLTYHWTSQSRLVADHVMAGSFDSAARLLLDQLGVVSIGCANINDI